MALMGEFNRKFTPAETAGLAAEENYLRAGDQRPAYASLQGILEGVKQVKMTPKRQLLLAGAHLDSAQTPEIGPVVAEYHLDEAEKNFRNAAAMDLETIPLEDYRFALEGRLRMAYLPLYRRRILEGENPSEEEYETLYHELLNIAGLTFAPATIQPSNQKRREAVSVIRGFQFELGVHMLMARSVLCGREDSYFAWPSLPRENTPHTYNFDVKEGVDMRLSQKEFLDSEAIKVQLKSVGEVDNYESDVLTIVGREDLGTRFSGEIIKNAYQEMRAVFDEDQQESAAEWLDEVKIALLEKIEDFNNVSLQS